MSTERGHTYGGQAVIEGVMIRGRTNVSVAVRRPDGTIALQSRRLSPLFTGRLRQVPLVRGVIALIEPLILGMHALSYSANVGIEEAGETALAAAVGDKEELVKESADLLYHALVLLSALGARPEDVWRELRSRQG